MGFLAAPLQWLAGKIVGFLVNVLYKKLIEAIRRYQDKKESQEIIKENLKEIKEAKNDEEKLKKQVDLLNGRKS